MSDQSELPKGWSRRLLGDIVTPRGERVSPQERPELPFIGMDNVEAHTMRLLGTVPSGSMKSAASYFQPHDVLYGRLRPYLNKVLRPEFEGLASAEFIVMPETCLLYSGFLQYRLNATDFVSFASHLNEGDRPRVTFDQIGIFKINVPPLAEQHRIVAKIEELFSDLDAGVAALERAKANLKRYRASVLKSAVEGNLTKAWRAEHPDVEPASVLLERILAERRHRWEAEQLAEFEVKGKTPPKNWREKYKEPVEPDTEGLPELPEGWCWATVEQICQFGDNAIKAGPFGSSLKKSFYVDDGYKVYGQEQVLRNDPYYGNYFIDDERFRSLESCAVKPGDLLISLVGTIGRTLILPQDIKPGIINPRLIKISINQDLVASKFVQLYFRSPQVRAIFSLLSHGGTMEILNMATLKTLVFPIPPRSEQEQVLEITELMDSIVDDMEQSIEEQEQRSSRLRQSILKRAFEGKLVPQDPSDEPASALLDHIEGKPAPPESSESPKSKSKRGRKHQTELSFDE